MSEAIGPGTFVQRISPSPFVSTGAVRLVLATTPSMGCTCGFEGPGLSLGIMAEGVDDWCANHWRPYHGPEQAKRLVCEEIDA
jgi:hypothetical protein